MKALVDTHVFLWAASDVPRISAPARAVIEDGSNEILLSVASIWEIALKFSKGKLELAEAPGQFVPSRMAKHRFHAMPVLASHALQVADLPRLHEDPFDRLLIAQAQVEQLPIVTSDSQFSKYGVEVIW